MKIEMTTIFDNKIYQDFISSLDLHKVKFQRSIVDIDARDVVISLKFDMRQTGIQPMIFNADFNQVQKTDFDGNPTISPQCFLRHCFDKNDLQKDFSPNGIIEKSILLRGGIKTSEKNTKTKTKDENSSNTKIFAVKVTASKFTKVKDDRLGFKADDKGDNYLCEDINYSDVVFNVEMRVSMNQFLKNIKGEDFAQKNALKVIEATDDECQKVIESCIPTCDKVLDLDKLVEVIQSKIANMRYFSHKGICAEFKIENMNISIEDLKK